MRKSTDPRKLVARKHLEVFRQENRQLERLLKHLNRAGTAADRLRQELDDVDRDSSVAFEIRKARELIQGEIVTRPDTERNSISARYETNAAALQANNAKLIEAIQQRARDNQLLVCRALAIVQSVVNAVGPTKVPASEGTSIPAAA